MERIQALQEFLAADPEDSFSRYALGLEYLSSGDLASAIETLEEVRRRDPDYLATYYQLGKAYHERGDDGRAVEVWQLGQKLAEKQGDWHTHGELQEIMDSL